jgi:hypothetical protein
VALLALVLSLLLAGCSDDSPDASPGTGDESSASPEPSPSISTLTPIPLPPEPPPTGRILADMRQSSRDAAAGRMEVWLDNDTAATITPTRIVYTDARFRTPVLGERLRAAPSQSTRGFPLYLPDQPACAHRDAKEGTGRVTVTYGGHTRTLPVEDSTDVVGRYVRSRCEEIAIARVADLSWDDQVVDGPVALHSHATLTLVVRPTGVAGHELVIDEVTGTPVLTSVGSWRPGTRISGTDPEQRIELPMMPARCDAHAFQESGGATAFGVKVHLDGEPGQIILRMSTEGAANAIAYARQSCGLGE